MAVTALFSGHSLKNKLASDDGLTYSELNKQSNVFINGYVVAMRWFSAEAI
jgi:hypothetical protein